MKKSSCIFVLISFFSIILLAQEFRKVTNTAFQRGEKLTYRVFYDAWLTSHITTGEVVLEVTKDNKSINGRNTYHIIGLGKTKGIFNLFFSQRVCPNLLLKKPTKAVIIAIAANIQISGLVLIDSDILKISWVIAFISVPSAIAP